MSYFIIIRGPLGCGKSTISKKLAETLGAEYISQDKVYEEHGLDVYSHEEGGIPAANDIKVNELVIPDAKRILDSGKIVIFDGCFYHKHAIEHLIKNLPYPHYIFTLKAPLEVCIERDKGRHKVYGEVAARTVHKLVSRFDYGLVIDVTKSLNEAVKEILSRLPKKAQ